MQIELFGCTNAGKSSLARDIVRSARELGVAAVMSEDFVLAQARLGAIRGGWVRTVLVDLVAFAACLGAWREQREFFHFVLRSVSGLPRAVGWPRRLNIARNVFKKAGIRHLIRRRASDRELVVMDEGTLHTAHYLFVQPCAEPDTARLGGFLQRVPLPDVAVYVREEESTLVHRTLARGHRRIPDRAHGTTALFVRRALRTLDAVADDARVAGRLLIVDRPAGSVSPALGADEPRIEEVLPVLRAATTNPVVPAAEPPVQATVST